MTDRPELHGVHKRSINASEDNGNVIVAECADGRPNEGMCISIGPDLESAEFRCACEQVLGGAA